MTFLPIVERELRVASRRPSTYWIRTAAAVSILFFGAWVYLFNQRQPPRVAAPILFYVLSGGAVVYAWAMGVNATADCLSREKREGTLGLLFLTDLEGYDIVFGKLAATSLNSIYSLLAIVPMLAIPLLMGGIAPAEFWRMSLVAVNTLFFSLALGMVVSAFSRSATRALLAAGVGLILFNGLLPACGAIIAAGHGARYVHPAFLLASSGYSYGMAFDAQHRGHEPQFWLSLGVVHLLGWAFLGMACLLAPRCWRDRPAGAAGIRWRDRWKLWSLGDSSQRAAFRKSLLDRNPIFWLAARMRLKPTYVWFWLGLVGCWWVWGGLKYGRDWLNEFIYLWTALMVSLFLRCWFAAEASRTLAEARSGGSLEFLLSTPLTVQDIVAGQRLALKRQFLAPVQILLGVECLFLLATLSEVMLESERPFWLCLWAALMLMQVADFGALYWVGLWRGLNSRSPHTAAINTMMEVLTTPWLIIAVFFLLLALHSFTSHSQPRITWQLFLGLWFLAGLGVDVGYGAYARRRVLTQFRAVVERRGVYRTRVAPGAGATPPAGTGGAEQFNANGQDGRSSRGT